MATTQTTFDVGDVVEIPITITDPDTGNVVDPTTIAVTLKKPDGTTQDVSGAQYLTHTGTGTFTLKYPTADQSSGRYSYRVQTTGTGEGAFTDVFYVLATDPGFIISLAQARNAIRALPSQTADDEDLRLVIAAATGPMEDICGPIIARNCDEWHDGGGTMIRLLQAPAISITTVTESYGAGYFRTLTQQDLDAGSFDAFGYTVDLADAILTRRISGAAGRFADGRRNVHVTYVAGRATIPPNIIRATRRLVRWLWQTEMQGISRPTSGQAVEATSTTPSGYRVPPSVIELCAAEAKIPGIA